MLEYFPIIKIVVQGFIETHTKVILTPLTRKYKFSLKLQIYIRLCQTEIRTVKGVSGYYVIPCPI